MLGYYILLLVVVYLGGGSRAGARQYCGPTAADDQTYFPEHVKDLLAGLVTNTQKQYSDTATGETTYAATNPADVSRAAAGNATCYRGVTGPDCGDCLKDAQQYLIPCRTFTSGGAYYDKKCFLQFWQLI